MVLITLLLLGCKEEPFVPASLGSVFGQVILESDNTPIEDVQISTNPPSTTLFTDVEGRFAFENITTGSYSLRIEKAGYVTRLESITVIPEQTTNVVIKLTTDEEQNNPPSIPMLLTPTDEEEVNVNTTFVWSCMDPDEDDLTYSLVLFENDLNMPVRTISDIQDSTYTIEDLNYDRQLYWQIIADDGQETTYSATQAFQTSPIPDFRYHFVREVDGQLKIFASDLADQEPCLSNPAANSWRPRLNPKRDVLGFIANDGIDYHIYTMDRSGANVVKLTTIPIDGYDNAELDFSWSPDGDRLAYMNNNKLYSLDTDGTNLKEIAVAPLGWTFAECDWSHQSDRILVRLVGQEPYNGLIYVVDLDGNYLNLIQSDVAGACGGGSWSIDGNFVLFTQDISGFESPDGRQLDSRIFLKNISTGAIVDLSDEKVPGTNDLDPRFSPDGAQVIFVNTSNDGISQRNIYSMDIIELNRVLIAENAFMPDWE